MHTKRRKILFYCQSLVGLGHLTSSLLVIRELLAYADVDLIHGGQGLQHMPELPGFRQLRLPRILIDSASDELYAPDRDDSIETVWAERAAAIERFVDWPYDAVIVEFFPFGRRRLKKEILGLFASVRQQCGAIPIFCFVREILVPAPLAAEQRMLQLVREHIHTVFVRGDPAIVRFEETFSLTAEIADRLVYVGYVSPPSPASLPTRQSKIVVSQGGGEIGKALLRAAVQTAPLLPDYQFLVVVSSRATAGEIAELQRLVQSSNVQVVSFLSNFQEHLQTAALSISLGGDNTLMDVISTRTPALAYPYAGNSEQGLRIEKLVGKGFVFPLTENDLVPERLSVKVRETIKQTYPQQAIAIYGAAEISQRIRVILEGGCCGN
ncbi:glycosyltransferase family protein [Methylomonas albis]|uniref:Glycosyl transferase n=1 Tax=Methylomonas albis TaxID=1854563 RepID=A0ABR9D176_9GAMM|nr:glycosyltransferase [Methylomonas albis]MBD9356848.1 glycosyl transferase [Methylomonas albis]